MRIGKKTIWTLMLAVLVVMLSFGSAWAAAGDITVDLTQTIQSAGNEGNSGVFTATTTTGVAAATKVYFDPNGTGDVTVKVEITADDGSFVAGSTITPSAASQPTATWNASVSDGADSNGGLATVVALTRAISGFSGTETVTVTLEDSASTAHPFSIEVTAVPVPLTDPDGIALFVGKNYTTEPVVIDLNPEVTGIDAFTWANLTLKNGSTPIADGDDIETSAGIGITANYSNTAGTITLKGTATDEMPGVSYGIYADDLKIKESNGFDGVPVAGVDNTASFAQFAIGVANFICAPNFFTFASGDVVPNDSIVEVTAGEDIKSMKVYFSNVGSSSAASSLSWSGLTLKVVGSTVKISGIPKTDSGSFGLEVTTASGTYYNDNAFNIAVNEYGEGTVFDFENNDPAITDEDDEPATELLVGQTMTITLDAGQTQIDDAFIWVTKPDGSKEKIGVDVKYDGLGNYSLEFSFKATMNGIHTFDVYYADANYDFWKETFTVNATGGRAYSGGGSSSSCSMGFGIAGILALAGVALIRRRESY